MRVSVRYDHPPVRVRFLSRPNRFLARVERSGGGPPFLAHLPNPGRMRELLIPGRTRGYVIAAPAPGRATHWDLVSVGHGPALVSLDTRLGNRIVRPALAAGLLPEFGPGPWRPEVRVGAHRIDFGVVGDRSGAPPRALLEVKCSNLRLGTTAVFPDAPTERGRQHLDVLARAARRGRRAGVLFIVERSDVRAFAAHRELDPGFAAALDRARAAGVTVRARTVTVTPGGATWGRALPVVREVRRTSLVEASQSGPG